MNRFVLKYPLKQVTEIDLPPKSKVLMVGMDKTDQPCIWIEQIQTRLDLTHTRTFYIFVTGEAFNSDFEHIGSFATSDAQFIGHVYELVK